MPLKVAIAVGPNGCLHPSALIAVLSDIWRQRGHRVDVTYDRRLDADIGFLHIDTSRIGPALMPDCPTGVPLVNGRAVDISKRRVSQNLVTLRDPYAGPVIVKTNDNYYGLKHFPKTRAHTLVHRLRKFVSPRSWRLLRTLPRSYYPILSSKLEIPSWVWKRTDLVVERFLPEIEDGFFVLRCWVFLGQHEYGVKFLGTDPVVKAGSAVRFEFIDDVPGSLRVQRERLGFDFGKFDYVVHDGTAVLLDANTTPVVARGNKVTPRMLSLADGLGDFGVLH